MIGLYGIAFWLPTIVEASGVRISDVGLITAIPYGCATLGMPIISRNSDRTGERRLHYALNMTAGAIGIALSGAFRATRPWPSSSCPSARWA